MVLNLGKQRQLFTSFITAVFLVQWVAQTVPHQESVLVGGDDMCTCGCGHTVEVCEQNHDNLGMTNSGCFCKHQTKTSTRIVVVPQKTSDIDLDDNSPFFIVAISKTPVIDFIAPIPSFSPDIPIPPPKTSI